MAAHATVPDRYGFGGAAMGRGGGGVAVARDGVAMFLNPAGLARTRRPHAAFGLSYVHHDFADVGKLAWDTNRDGTIDQNDAGLDWNVDPDDAVGLQVAAGRNVGGKFGIGIGFYLPTQRLLRMQTMEPSLPQYFMYQNRSQRYVLAVGLGGEVLPGLSIGVGGDTVPTARVRVSLSIDAQLSGDGSEADDVEDLVTEVEIDVHQVELDLIPGFAPVAGIHLDFGRWVPALDGLTMGASYRGSVGLPIDVDIDGQVNVDVEDVGELEPYLTAVVLQAGLSMYDHYSPARFDVGLGYEARDLLTAYVDVRYTMWSGMPLAVAQVSSLDVTAPLVDLDSVFVDGNDYSVVLRDTVSVRAGLEWVFPRWYLDLPVRYLRIRGRVGGGYEPSALASQGANSAFLDADRLWVTAGGGVEFWDPFKLVDGPIGLDAYAQYHALGQGTLPRQASEPTAGYPLGQSGIPIGGSIFVAGIEWSFDY